LSTDQVQDEGSQLRRLVKEQGEQISRLKSAQQHHILKFNALTIVIESCMNRKGLTIDIFEEVDKTLAEEAAKIMNLKNMTE
ncbi:MAG: hypothetical protein WBA23_13255, partial [Tunicatimonas sp.]|uniref:hypothetical protein n=1 Tax=Tunicatimonas sp. TaxID=1940096 RepID=UPI003C71B19F